ncbi:MAG: hypothetical protein HY721_22555 [Planctomycetes bacterium]|nr:hypothetical protein [Planctomycetota bacterium]
MLRRLAAIAPSSAAIPLAALALLLFTGCPHRSPVWSPDGTSILVLAGKAGEEIDKAASQLWLVAAASGKAARLECPEAGSRYLSAAWLGPDQALVLTGKWTGDFIEEGSEKAWRVATAGGSRAGGSWKALPLPAPNEARATRRPPVVIRDGSGWKPGDLAAVYPAGAEAVVVAEVEAGKELLKLEPAELVGPGPGGGFLVHRPSPEDSGTIEVAAFGADLKVLWRKKLSELRDAIARRFLKAPVEIVFNDTTTSHLPPRGEEGWVGLSLIFSDVAWKDGIPGFYLKLDAKTGDVLAAVRGVGLSGRPSTAKGGGSLWAVLAPDPKAKLPVRLEAIAVADGKALSTVPLPDVPKEAVHGYAFDRDGKHFAVSLNATVGQVRIFAAPTPEKPRVVELK